MITPINLLAATGSGPQFHRFQVAYSDLSDADTAQTIDLCTLRKGSIIIGVRIKHAVYFRGGSVSACTVSVGSAAGAVNDFATAFDIYQAVGDTTFQLSDQFKAMTYAEDTLQATFTTTTDNINNLASGLVYIDVLYLPLTTPSTYL